MQFNRRKKVGQFVILGIIIVAVVATTGCQSSWTKTSLPSGTYRAYPFTYNKGDLLEATLNSADEPLNVMILHGGNFSRYQQGEDYFADEFRKGVTSTRLDFNAPLDGEYYLILENRNPRDVNMDFSFTSHTLTRYEAEPLEGAIRPEQKEPQGVSGILVQTSPTTIIPIETTQPTAVAPQNGKMPASKTIEAQQLHDNALLLAQQGNLTGALTLLDQALQLDPDNEITWMSKSVVLIQLERYEEGLNAAERATALDPNNADAWVIKEWALLGLGRYEEGLTAAERATTVDPNDADAWTNKAAALLVLERYEEGLTAAERATTLNPNDAIAWNNKAYALVQLGRTTEALASAELATKIDPNYALAWNTKGYVENEMGRYADAIASFDRALEIDPDYEQAKSNKAWALEKLGS